MSQLILLRHGQSMWNALNLFTGWVDVPLAKQGISEAINAGKIIKDIPIDHIFTSTLVRAQMTAMLAITEHQSGKVPVLMHSSEWNQHYGDSSNIIPVTAHSQLNERMYGKLQGLNKEETAQKYGAEQVKIWRRSYDISPPEGESLKDTAARALPFFKETIVPELQKGKNILVSAHGNSLRSIMMELDHLTKEQVIKLEIPTGVPILYQYNYNHHKEEGTFIKQQF